MRNPRTGLLRRVGLFAELSDDDLVSLASKIEEITLDQGETLFTEGDAGERAYVIVSGEVEILKVSGSREVLLAVRKECDVIGEMALLQEAPRSATARARADSTLMTITKVQLDELLATSITAMRAMFSTLLDRWQETQQQMRHSERMAQLGTLTAGVAHELNNPAAAVKRAAGHLGATAGALAGDLLAAFSVLEPGDEALLDRIGKSMAAAVPPTDPITQSDLEAELEGALDDLGVPEPWRVASEAASSGLTAADVTTALDGVTGRRASAALGLSMTLGSLTRVAREIGEGAHRISEIVKSLKSYSYLDQAPIQDVDLRQGIEDTLVLLAHKTKGVSIERTYPDDLPTITANGTELNQVWTNLLDNAIDATGEGGRIQVRVTSDTDTVVVEVEDDGPGIPEDIRARVFDAFFTTKPPGKGTGLGLSLSYRIVVLDHRGDLTVTSEPGRTVFRVELPLAQG